MEATDFSRLVALATGGQTPRVWSLLVTVFGDLAQDRDARISGALLATMTEMIGIKPEAMRVALHRLRGKWIESERQGRNSVYFLDGEGRSQSAKATPLIYSREAPQSRAFVMICESGGQGKSTVETVWITSQIAVSSSPGGGANCFSSELAAGQRLPDWMARKVAPADLVAQSAALAGQFDALLAALDGVESLSPVQVAVLRVLVVHGWRRIVVKQPRLPDHVFDEGWRGAKCRLLVAQLLARLPKPVLATLEQAVA